MPCDEVITVERFEDLSSAGLFRKRGKHLAAISSALAHLHGADDRPSKVFALRAVRAQCESWIAAKGGLDQAMKSARYAGVRRVVSQVDLALQLPHYDVPEIVRLQTYVQDEDERLDRHAATEEGWCLALALYWLVRRRKGLEFWSWMRTGEAEGDLVLLMKKQEHVFQYAKRRQGKKTPSVGGSSFKIAKMFNDEFFARAGSDVGLHTSFWTPSMALQGEKKTGLASALEKALEAAPPTDNHFLIGLQGDKGGHAVGVIRAGGTWTYMDPNLGEYAITATRTQERHGLGKSLHDFFKLTGYHKNFTAYRIAAFS